MSTTEERLKQEANRLEVEHLTRQQKEEAEAIKQRDDLRQRAQEVAKESQEWINRTEALVAATGKLILVRLTRDPDEPSFELSIGTSRVRVARRTTGWHIVETSPGDLHPKSGLPVGNIGVLREQLIERMVKMGLHDLYEIGVKPPPDMYRCG